ncbi:hypothetical protein PLEOSDRAFT_1035806 [Pleurotus ostreatus PC15]|uniref:DH domain-containing protein n=1 Tax=Pleurotus ostreatus (strain PC15) TaxID=1137138 RepID=A0A067P2R8_PLEO1|nr:hypothetical protein PLEOSDRAFT_1035806 [Pleurotus ostreatus PC15]
MGFCVRGRSLILGTSLGGGLVVPLTPSTPTTPTTPTDPNTPTGEGSGRSKKTNPLTDLIETEKVYVELLTGIIRKVAAAWSRSNLPPPDLDAMFRSIESVYKANRSLLLKLKEIGTNPSSPKALGDLLMRWIDDLETPYTSYCGKYVCGFDEWEPVQSNNRLPGVMATFSAANPPPSSSESPLWSLDALFLLPKGRLKYYKKLYSRLLKSTTPGRSDHRLLLGAIEKLEKLLETLENRSSIRVGAPVLPPVVSAPTDVEDEVVIGPNMASMISTPSKQDIGSVTPVSEGSSSARASTFSGYSIRPRSSQETTSTSLSRTSTNATMTMPISDLERRLSTARTLDIFTMKPKVVRLQMLPPHLPFTREMRISIDAVIRFTPRATGVEVVHPHGHIFLLSDLFLVCDRMSPEERAQNGDADMWLCYPPLAGKVLRVSEVPGQDNALQAAIMRKETLIIETESPEARNRLLSELSQCIEFAGTVAPVPKQPPPPMPPLNTIHQITHGNAMHANQATAEPERGRSPPNSRAPPTTPHREPSIGHTNGVAVGQVWNPPRLPMIDPPVPPPPGSQRGPPLHQFNGSPVYPPMRSTSAVGQQIPPGPTSRLPARSPSTGPPGAPNPMPQMHNPAMNSLPPRPGPGGPPPNGAGPSDPNFHGGLRKSVSSRSLTSQYDQQQHQPGAPPIPPFPGGYPPNPNFVPRSNSQGSISTTNSRSVLPSLQMGSRATSFAGSSFADPSPPDSPVDEPPMPTGPVTSTISAQMKCKVFLQQQHAQWKSLGAAKLKLYHQAPTNIKQLVVEAEKDKAVLISTIVLTDGVERVAKTGVAIELSNNGSRTGIIYMIQLRKESSANGLFESLIAGSDRATK